MTEVKEAASRPKKIRFDPEDDIFLLKEVAAENPFEDGSKWKVVADKMKQVISKDFTHRNLRERANHLLQRYKLHFEEWKVARSKDKATHERITLLQEVRDLKLEFQGRRPKKVQQEATQTGKLMREEAAKNRVETVETLMVDSDDELILDYPNSDVIEIDDASNPSQTGKSAPSSAPIPSNQHSGPGSPLRPPSAITQSPPTPSPRNLASWALVGNSPVPSTSSNQMTNYPGTLSNQTSATARSLKRKRGMNATVGSFMARKQDMEANLKRRQFELEERKFEEEAARKRMELELEEKKHNLQLRMFEHQVKKEGETIQYIRELLERQEARDTNLLQMIGQLFKSLEELLKK